MPHFHEVKMAGPAGLTLVHNGFVPKHPINIKSLIKAVLVETGMEIEHSEESASSPRHY